MIRRAPIVLGVCLSVVPDNRKSARPVSSRFARSAADRTIVFRFWATAANQVQLSETGRAQPFHSRRMPKESWKRYTRPPEPNIYQYSLFVDGVRTDDPSCRCTYTFGAGRGVSNRFIIGAKPQPAVWEPQNKPPGTLHHERFLFAVATAHARVPRLYPTRIRFQRFPEVSRSLFVARHTRRRNGVDQQRRGCDIIFDNPHRGRSMTPAIVVMHASDVNPAR
jgi:enterochelin esterase family protein